MRTPGRNTRLWLGTALLFSGAAGLVFEVLWFRLAGLLLGNSVAATSVVLASFMAGIALGNARAVRLGRRADAARTYMALELVIGLSGLAVVLALPFLNRTLAPFLSALVDRPILLHIARSVTAFSLLALPATAMGATLPVCVQALASGDSSFGRVLGRLYALNTLGGLAGVLLAEFVLVPAFGIRLSGVTAGLLNLAAAACAWRSAEHPVEVPRPEPVVSSVAGVPRRPLVAAFLAGALLLSLEVVWFRLLLLFVFGSSANFAILLGVVLSGIAAGGLLAAAWLSRRPADHTLAAPAAFAAGAITIVTYVGYCGIVDVVRASGLTAVALLAFVLMLPTCILSGTLFTLLGQALKSRIAEPSAVAGRLTLANTLGAMTGALLGGFVLLPVLGAEASLWSLAAVYGVIGLLSWPATDARQGRRFRVATAMVGAGLAAALSLFPFGLMQGRLLALVRRAAEPDLVPVAIREGLTETVQYTRRELFGLPLYYRLLTNGYSMSGTNLAGQRYMGLYVYWPMALRPRAESALLISYGVGITARALVATPGLRSIDVVDVSREILSMSAIPFGADGDPLRDPRVRVHVEDGRFFLQSTERRFDLITGEPPPPKASGIVTLYTLEYFRLMRSHLNPGGLATYWLPVNQLHPREARAITAAFCQAFEDCTLWTGAGSEWMLAGSNGPASIPSAADFARQWTDPVVGARLRDVALESPADLAGLFLGDAAFLAEYARGVPPLTDDRPHRLSPHLPSGLHPEFVALMTSPDAARRFQESAWTARNWPEEWQRAAAPVFTEQGLVTAHLLAAARPGWSPDYALVQRVLEATRRVALPRLLLGVSPEAERIALVAQAEGLRDPDVDYLLGVSALVRREYPAAAARFEAAIRQRPDDGRGARGLVLAYVMAGDRERAAAAAAALRGREGSGDTRFWSWWEALPAAR